MTFSEGRPRPVACVVVGGEPPPVVDILFGKERYTDRFSQELLRYASGEKGLRQLETRTVVWTERFSVAPKDDGRKLKCRATVAGFEPATSITRIQVNCEWTHFLDGYITLPRTHLSRDSLSLVALP